MKKQLKWILAAAGLVVLLIAAGAVYRHLSARVTPETTTVPASQEAVTEQSAAPDCMLLDAEGNETRLSDHRGKPVVVNFWATWCPYCVDELPLFDEAAKTYGDRIDFMVVDLVDGSRETVEKAKSYLDENGLTFPAYFDTTTEAAFLFNITSIPVTVFIHPDGTVMDSCLGTLQKDALQAYIDRLLA